MLDGADGVDESDSIVAESTVSEADGSLVDGVDGADSEVDE